VQQIILLHCFMRPERQATMSDLKQFIQSCAQQHPDEFKDFDKEYAAFKLGVLLKQARTAKPGLPRKTLRRV
jgi:hypothetical protein